MGSGVIKENILSNLVIPRVKLQEKQLKKIINKTF